MGEAQSVSSRRRAFMHGLTDPRAWAAGVLVGAVIGLVIVWLT